MFLLLFSYILHLYILYLYGHLFYLSIVKSTGVFCKTGKPGHALQAFNEELTKTGWMKMRKCSLIVTVQPSTVLRGAATRQTAVLLYMKGKENTFHVRTSECKKIL